MEKFELEKESNNGLQHVEFPQKFSSGFLVSNVREGRLEFIVER